jgi:hypothetical protein
MFLENYLDEFYYNQVLDNYKYEYLENIDVNNFKQIYDILVKYNFDYIEDIILNYIELFELEPSYVEDSIKNLIDELGDNYVRIIGNDMRYFINIIDNEDINED